MGKANDVIIKKFACTRTNTDRVNSLCKASDGRCSVLLVSDRVTLSRNMRVAYQHCAAYRRPTFGSHPVYENGVELPAGRAVAADAYGAYADPNGQFWPT
jgi:hypothetical protein